MTSFFLLVIHLLVLAARLLTSGGVKSVIAENLILKHQLIVLARSRRKAPNLKTSDRFIFGGLSLLFSAHRRLMTAVIVKPSTLLRFHRALVERKYSRLFSNKGNKRPGPKGPSWLSLLGHSKDGLLSTDNDPLFKFHRWQANLRILDVKEIKSVPYVPMSHPFIERVIGTIRREYLDRAPFWNPLDLARKLDDFKDYYNRHRTHAALSGQSPATFGRRAKQTSTNINDYRWQSHCRGLFQTPHSA